MNNENGKVVESIKELLIALIPFVPIIIGGIIALIVSAIVALASMYDGWYWY